MYRGSGPRVLPLIIAIIVIALVIAALVTVGRMLFSGGGDTDPKKDAPGTSLQDTTLERTADRSVRWTVRGPIVADEKYRSYQITVSPNSRMYVTYSGYLEQVISTKSYDNNAKAYEEFVYALDKAAIGKTRNDPTAEFRGVCATQGVAYMYETLKNNDADNSVWSSTCKDSPGTMGADPLKIQALFVNQIPDFNPLFNQIY